MKKAAKILTIVFMICGCFMILPLIFGIISLKKQNTGTMNLTWKILTLIFVCVPAGILLLIAKDEPAAAPAAHYSNGGNAGSNGGNEFANADALANEIDMNANSL